MVAKLQGDNQHPSLPWNFITHGFLDPSAFADHLMARTPLHEFIRGRELNPNIFFSNFSGASGISRQNPGISRPKSLIPWVSRDIPNFLAPAPSRGRPPPHQKISGLKSLGLGSFFVPDLCYVSWGPIFLETPP